MANTAVDTSSSKSLTAGSIQEHVSTAAKFRIRQPQIAREAQQYGPKYHIRPFDDAYSGGKTGIPGWMVARKGRAGEHMMPQAQANTQAEQPEMILCALRRNGSKGQTTMKDGSMYTLETEGRKPGESRCELGRMPSTNPE